MTLGVVAEAGAGAGAGVEVTTANKNHDVFVVYRGLFIIESSTSSSALGTNKLIFTIRIVQMPVTSFHFLLSWASLACLRCGAV